MKTLALEIHAEMIKEFEVIKRTVYFYRLPVRAINSVQCFAGILLKAKGVAYLDVGPVNIAYFDEYGEPGNLVYFRQRFEDVDDFSQYTPEYLEAILLSANKILSTLKFNRLLGRFQHMTPGIQDLHSFSQDLHSFESENVQTDFMACRTCGEATRCKTNCSCGAQYLCFVCWDHIQPVLEEQFGDFVDVQRCPGCNEELVFSRHLQR